MKKIISLVLCILLVVALAAPAWASEDTPPENRGVLPITEEDGSGETPPHEHSWGEGVVTKEPTCISAGEKTYTCACGAVNTETIAASGHSYGGWQETDSGHQRQCSVCSTVESGSHSWTEQITLQPTCTTEGQKTLTCACGASTTQTIPVTDHSYGDWSNTDSSHSRTCTVCGTADAASGGHSWAVSITYPATCVEEGVKAYGCSVCGYVKTEVIPKLTTHTYDSACDPDCNICGATRDAAHKFSTVWSKNASGHWHVCTVCGEKTDMGSHYPGPAATEEKAQICLTCGYTMTAKLNHSHKYETKWTSDEDGHWYACSGCEEQKDFSEHVYDDPCDPDCNICGYVTPTAHVYDGTWLSDETGHWAVCTLCGEESEGKAHTPGPEATEEEPQLCTTCGFELAPVHVHTFEETWLMDEEAHWKECACGEKGEEALHTWDEGTEEDGIITYVCAECGAEKTEEVPETEEGGFPWWIVIIVTLALVCAAAVAVILILRPGKQSGKYHR